MPELSQRVGNFTDSVIRRMTRISNQYGAINLSQGFPDFDPPKEIMDALAKAAYEGPHQYSITYGAQNFREALAAKQGKAIHRIIDPNTEIVVTCGGTEAMMCAMMTICNPGDKVMVFSPFYENYGADAILSGAEPSTFRWFRRNMSLISGWWSRASGTERRLSLSAIHPTPAERCSARRSLWPSGSWLSNMTPLW